MVDDDHRGIGAPVGTITATPSTANIGDSIALGFKLDNPGAVLGSGAVTLHVINPHSVALLMEAPTPNVSIAASGQWSQTYRWTVPQGAPAHVLVIASLGTAGCEEAVATAALKIGNGGNGTATGTETGNAKKVPVHGPVGLLLLSAALACLAAKGRHGCRYLDHDSRDGLVLGSGELSF